jgi:hypothetical protein
MPMDERHELISHLDQLRAVLRATKDVLHRSVLEGLIGYLERRLQVVTKGESPIAPSELRDSSRQHIDSGNMSTPDQR